MDPGYEVWEYSRRGSLVDLREVLSNGTPPDLYMAYDGGTALVVAARNGYHEIVDELLAYKANAHIRTEEGSTLLHHAVSGGSTKVIKAFIAAGVDVNEGNEDGITPIVLAAHYGMAEITEALCEAGADIHRSVDGWGNALDSATGDAVGVLEARGGKRSMENASFEDQPLAAAAERFCYGCFESGENPNPVANHTPTLAPASFSGKIKVGDKVQLRLPRTYGLLRGDATGVVIEDDGSDSLPLKVQLGDAYDYYDHADLELLAPPDSDRATADGTMRYLASKKVNGAAPFGKTGLSMSPVGFGCHRLNDVENHKSALSLAIQLGCNIVDLAPNYTDGEAETVAGAVIEDLIKGKKIRRDQLIIMSKVGNVLGQQLKHSEGVPNMARINDNLCHCISPAWIEQEITRSLERLRVKCIDCILLHCPEYEVKSGIDMTEVYSRLKEAFKHLESEVVRGRIASYGVSGAFYPLRPTDPEHLDLDTLMKQLPETHHFSAVQFPLNYAEAQVMSVSHTPRTPEGAAIDKERGLEAPTLFEAARAHGLAVFTNRPLDGIYKESHGVLRFSSLDADVRMFSELQLDNCDAMEEKLTNLCKLDQSPYHAGEGAAGQLATKTVKTLCSLADVDCVLLGMRQPEYVVGTLALSFGTPPLPAEVARNAVKALHSTVTMWYATAIHESDHGTAKDWRLPMPQKQISQDVDAADKSVGA